MGGDLLSPRRPAAGRHYRGWSRFRRRLPWDALLTRLRQARFKRGQSETLKPIKGPVKLLKYRLVLTAARGLGE